MRFKCYLAAIALSFSLTASAVIQFAILPGIALAFESGSVAVGYAASLALIGSALAFITFADSSSSAASSTPPIYARLVPNAPMPVPDGWNVDENGNPIKPATAAISGSDFGYTSSGRLRYYMACWINTNPDFATLDTCSSGAVLAGDGCREGFLACSGFCSPNRVCKEVCSSSGALPPCDDGYNFSTRGYSATDNDDPRIININGSPADSSAPFPPDGVLVVDYNGGSWSINPRDTGDASNVAVSITGDGLSYSNGGSKIDFVSNGSGLRVSSSVPVGEGVMQNVQYDIQPDGNGKMILVGGSTSNTPGGVGTNPGLDDSGSSNVSCGGVGQPSCTVDDSAFSGKGNFDTSAADSSFQGHINSIENVDSLDVGFSWLPSLLPGAPVSCYSVPVSFTFSGLLSGRSVSDGIDVCSSLSIARSILGYLFGVAAVIYIWRRFSHANDGA
jgi:hypothetical protein